MRIYSKFNDYYDHVVSPSDTVLWRRAGHNFVLDVHKQLPISKSNTEFLLNAFNKTPLPPITLERRSIQRRHTDVLLLGFCGKLYAIYLLYLYFGTKTDLRICTNIMEFVEIYNSNKSPAVYIEKSRGWHRRFPFNEQGMKNWYQEVNQTQRVQDIFIELKAPVFLIKQYYVEGEITLYVNPNMSEYGLQRVFDPWTAYQEIEMYLSNTLAVGVEVMPTFTDELKRDAHGFDNWSFKQIGPKPRKAH